MSTLDTRAPDLVVPPGQAEDSPHYLRSVTEMAARCQVTTRQAVYNDRGVKLLDQGMRVDRGVYDRLVQHRLQGTIDEQLAVQGVVDVAGVVQLATQQCAEDALAGLLARTLGPRGAERLLAPVRALVLPHALAFRLTVMREQHAQLYEHSVRMLLTSIFLALQAGMDERDTGRVATAALLHDIGVLHMPPEWRDPRQRLTGERRKELLVHPVTAALVVQAQGSYPPAVVQAVLEHHERMDGSGYPRGLRGAQISPLGQVLLLAEVTAGFFEKYADEGGAQRLSLTLRMGHRRFPPALAAGLLPALDQHASQKPLCARPAHVQTLVGLLNTALEDWDRRCLDLPPEAFAPQGGRACAFVTQQLVALQKALFEAGSHPQQQAQALDQLQDDEDGLAELVLLGREALWQLQGVVDAAHGRWPRLHDSPDPADQAVAQWGDALAQRVEQAQTPPA
ncbi:HD domain-containing protein [Oryzisolibacter propanilivorax]|uniref:HD domain-containing protein n=1 Tax=Oryzisolibacter propanilivorax TaxID=1527607 RepID=A0A1G9P8M7_9BURK|nr:HD domain-containing phosphohydrolase [Oryzisolibacter propanilivorax]SDL95109.1 HD domain-containing protein [Oryzisolibacter propanilivorax]